MHFDNFDSLGLMGVEELRRRIKRAVPDWHLEGIPSISYRPAEFFPCGDGEHGVVVGLYNKKSHEIAIRVVAWDSIRYRLEAVRAEFLCDDVMAMLNRKRDVVEAAYVQFAKEEKNVLRIIYHEIGHHVYSLLKIQDSLFESRWKGIHEASAEHVTSYADCSAEENFAECYMTYVSNRDMLSRPCFSAEHAELQRWFVLAAAC